MNRHAVTSSRTGFFVEATFAVTLLALPGCFGFRPSDPSPGLQAAFIDVSAGDNQSGAAGTTLPDEIVALVRLEGLASAGAPAPNVEVVWRVTGGGGTVVPEVSTTDAHGLARTRWILGPAAGRQTLAARIAGFTSGGAIPEADFIATATVRPDGPTSGGSGGSGGSGPQSPDGNLPGGGGAGGPNNAGAGGATGTGGASGSGGANGTGGASGGTSDGPRPGTGGTSGTGGANGAGGSAGPPLGPTTPGTGGAGGAGGAPGLSTCGVTCVADGPFCHCRTNPDCNQEYAIACPKGAAGNCTCVQNGAAVKTIGGSACDISQLSDPAGCGFPLIVPQ